MSDPNPAPGWYPAPHANNEQRYWNGSQWLDAAPVAPFLAGSPNVDIPAGVAPVTVETAPGKKKSSKKGWIIAGSIAAGVIVVSSIGGAINGGKQPDTKPQTVAAQPETNVATEDPVEMIIIPDVTGMTAAEAIAALTSTGLTVATVPDPLAKVVSTNPAAGTEAEEGEAVILTVEEKPKLTLSQQNVIREAQSYLDYSGFSRTGLIGQLEYEGYPTEDATFGADNAGADWNAECAESAQSYLDYSTFSREGLADQLAYEGFTQTEIDFGLAAVGY